MKLKRLPGAKTKCGGSPMLTCTIFSLAPSAHDILSVSQLSGKLISAQTKQRFAFSSGVNSLASSSNLFVCLPSRCFVVKQDWKKRKNEKWKIHLTRIGLLSVKKFCLYRRNLTSQILSEIIYEMKTVSRFSRISI